MPENDLNQPFEDFFYEKLKASEDNPTTIKKKNVASLNQDIPNEVSNTATLPTPPLPKNKAPSVPSRTKTKPISSLKCNLTNGNSKSKSTLSSSSSKSSNGKGTTARRTVSSNLHETSKRQTSSKLKLPETTKKILSLNDSDDCDNDDDDDYDNSVEDDDDFIEGECFLVPFLRNFKNIKKKT